MSLPNQSNPASPRSSDRSHRPSLQQRNSSTRVHQSPSASRRHSLQLSSGSEQFPTMPQRHSRPMTPAELHSELEREQEGIVNRLSRELQNLRAHSSSVASNNSASSAHSQTPSQAPNSAVHPAQHSLSSAAENLPNATSSHSTNHLASQMSLDPLHPVSSPRIPTANRQHRSSSSSVSNSSRTQSFTSSVAPPIFSPSGMASQASMERARDAAGIPDPNAAPLLHSHTASRSRRGSMRSGQPSPAPTSQPPTSVAAERRSSQQLHSTRAEEALAARESLGSAKTENEELIAKVKQLEKQLKDLGDGEEMRGRVGQPSTMASPGKPASAMEDSR